MAQSPFKQEIEPVAASIDRAADSSNLPPQLSEERRHEARKPSFIRRPLVLTAAQAAALVQDGDTILINGSGGGVGTPERFLEALADRYRQCRRPTSITAVHPVGCGDWGEKGMSRLALPGLLKRQVTGSLGNSPATMAMAAANEIEAFTLPQGVLSQLCREIAAGRPGLITHVGLGSFVDPRDGGGRQTARAPNDMVELILLHGREFLFYPAFRVDVAVIRATTADEAGNLTMEREPFIGDALAMAQAAHNSGGVVIAQVERMRAARTGPSREVKVPGILVDAIVVDPDQPQTYAVKYNPGYSGEIRVPVVRRPPAEVDPHTVIARRACLELFPGCVANLGYGVSTGVARILAEEDLSDSVTLTVEQGIIGGTPVSGNDFGAAVNYDALIEQAAQFDFYDGGGLDIAFLSFAEVDGAGNVNVSRFAGKPNGSGGFIHIAQNAKTVCFLGTLTTGGLVAKLCDGGIRIEQEGRHRRFVSAIEQRTYDRARGFACGQKARFITERAVLEADEHSLTVIEIAPGVDLDRDVLAHFEAPPCVSDQIRPMPDMVFRPGDFGLREVFTKLPGPKMHQRLASLLERGECI
jgi:propionate CoA-transferase